MDWFFNQVVYGTELCDYAVASISNRPIRGPSGMFEDTDDCVRRETKTNDIHRAEVVIHRLESLYFPIEILITFDDGETILENWEGKERSRKFSYEGERQVVSAEVDPQRKIYLDKNFINNSLSHGS